MTDIWTGLGDSHVILALTPAECKAAIDKLLTSDDPNARRAGEEIMRSARDQDKLEAEVA